jgi:hypothetical protein
MGMTATMQVLRLLSDEGECSLDQVVSACCIPTSRAVAALGALTRAGDAAKAGHRYSATAVGRSKAQSWGTPPARAGRGAGRG